MVSRSATRPGPGRLGVTVGQERVARWTILVYILASVFAIFWLPRRSGPREQDIVDGIDDVLNLPVLHNLLGVVLLILLTGALVRRKRFAWWIVIVTQLLGILYGIALLVRVASGHWFGVFRGVPADRLDQVTTYLGGAVGLLLTIILWWARAAFPALRSPGSRRATLLVLLVGGGFSIAVGIALAEATISRPGHRWLPVLEGLRAALGLDTLLPRPVAAPRLPPWAITITSILSAIVLVAAVGAFLRSGRGSRTRDSKTELAVRALLTTGGHDDSLGYFATRRDKAVISSPSGRAAVSYRVIASVCLASADPLGDPADWPAAIDAWQNQARRYGWVPAVLSAGKSAAQAYVAAGLRAIPLGDEAIIDTTTFTLAGPAMKAVRQAVQRVRRSGYTVSIRRHRDIDPAELAELAVLADTWRGQAPERGFSMALSRLGDPVDGNCVMVLVNAPTGEPAGLLSFVPWGRRDVSLDLMRRSPAAINGLIETMVVTLIERHAEFGIRRISLNFAMFREAFAAAEEFGAGPFARLNNAVLGVFSRFFQLESLYRSNAKYRPQWVPRYLCTDSPLSLPRVAFAAGVAEGFLPSPGRGNVDAAPPDPWLLQSLAELDAAAGSRPEPRRRRRQQEQVRRDRLAILDAAGMAPYPVGVPRTGPLEELAGAVDGTQLSAAGRVELVRDFGGVVFVLIGEGSARLQLVVERDRVGLDSLTLLRRTVDRGDLLSATGSIGRSRSGERSLLVVGWQMATKSLRSLPSARVGLRDPEARVRDRSADLIVTPDAAAMVARRSTAVGALRDGFRRRGFAEVETPILQSVHGGAAAAPFRTHINAYHRDLVLRIAPELFLKRLVVGGTGAIFEIGRNFRNEGADATHNPEFTSLEAYLPYADYHRMREITAEVICEVATAVHGSPVAMRPGADGQRTAVDLSGTWPTITVHDAVSAACGAPVDPGTSLTDLLRLAADRGVEVKDGDSAGELVMELYDRLVEPNTVAPTFYTDFPVETSPLTRTHRSDPRLSERWDLVAFGMEIGTAYSELTDPIDQRARLTEQSLRAAAGDEEAMKIDEDFLAALELGMPPTGGLGLGVDRIVMMLTGAPIRAVLTFPFVRPVDGAARI